MSGILMVKTGFWWIRYKGKQIPGSQGHLYVNHGLMMTAGKSSAAIFDGENWKALYDGAYLDE